MSTRVRNSLCWKGTSCVSLVMRLMRMRQHWKTWRQNSVSFLWRTLAAYCPFKGDRVIGLSWEQKTLRRSVSPTALVRRYEEREVIVIKNSKQAVIVVDVPALVAKAGELAGATLKGMVQGVDLLAKGAVYGAGYASGYLSALGSNFVNGFKKGAK
jgi:hypothetical protein